MAAGRSAIDATRFCNVYRIGGRRSSGAARAALVFAALALAGVATRTPVTGVPTARADATARPAVETTAAACFPSRDLLADALAPPLPASR